MAIVRIVDRRFGAGGESSQREIVLREQTSYMVTDMLRGVIERARTKRQHRPTCRRQRAPPMITLMLGS